MTEDKTKLLEEAFKQIEKQFGKGSIMRLGEKAIGDIEVIPSGSIGLDMALGVGGYPRGRIIEIFGPESSGKNDFRAACHRRSAETRRVRRLYRRRARP